MKNYKQSSGNANSEKLSLEKLSSGKSIISNQYKKLLIIMLLVFTLFTLILLSSSTYAFSIDKTTYYIGEPVIITLDNMSNVELSINNALRLIPDSLKSVYITEDAGNYTLCLSNTITRQMIECLNFEVFIDYNYSLLRGTNIDPNGIIMLDRMDFTAQELFTILLDLNNTNISLNNIMLTIRNEQTFYRYLYLDDAAVSFTPYYEGFYEIFVSDAGQVIASKTIYVKPVITKSNNADIALVNNTANNVLLSTPSSTSKPLNIRTNKKNGLTGAIKILDNGLDKDKFDVSIDFDDQHMKQASFKGVNSDFDIGLEMPENPLINEYVGQPIKYISFDPGNTIFDNGTITMIAEGTELWKCKDYNFASQQCTGRFVKVMDIIPGQPYDIELSMQDPLWTEVVTMACSCEDSAAAVPGAFSDVACDVYCPVTVAVSANFSDGFIQRVSYNVTITLVTTSTGVTANHFGNLDFDQVKTNGNESRIGSSTSTSTTTEIWTNSTMLSTTFNKQNCPTWYSGYCTYYIYLNSTAANGQKNKDITNNISLNSMSYTWNYTTFPPQAINVNLIFPDVYATLNYRNINFSYYLNSSVNITNCSLYDNETSWSLKLTNTSAVTNMSNNYFYKTFGSDGTYLWNVRCNSPTNGSFANANYTFTIDTVAPSINLMSPNTSAYLNSSSIVTFKFNVSDATSISNCSLFVNDVYKTILTPITMDVEQSIDYYLENGFYNWFINCTDIAGNSNVSLKRNFTINYTQPAWTGTWYETSIQSYTSAVASINLANSRDATDNNISTIAPGTTAKNIINATTPYFGGNGVLIPANTGVSFSGMFRASDNKVYVSWHLDILNSSGNFEIASFGNDATTGAYRINPANTLLQGTGSDTITSDTRLQSTDKLVLRIVVYNSEATNPTITHYWDNAQNSYVILNNWINLGYMYADLIEPRNNLTLNQNDVFNMTCAYNCTGGSCINSRVIVQYNTSNTTWTNIGASGPLVLNGTQQNNVSVGNVTTYGTSLFWIRVSTSTTTNIRCIANSDYSTADGIIYRQISGADAQNPSVTLVSPNNYNWTNSTTKTFIYTATDNTVVGNCSLYINGLFNRSNSSIGAGNNNFTVSGFTEGNYNWSVLCFDTSGNSNMTNNRTLYVDYTKPSILLNFPDNQSTLNYNTIKFNFTFNDNLSPNGTCDLYVDGLLSQPNIFVSNGLSANYTKIVNVSYHNWSVYCRDLATNFNTSLIYYFNITSAPPIIVLDTPANNTWLNYSTNIVLKYNLTDGSAITNCSLYLNGIYNQSNTSSVSNPGTNNFTFASMNNQKYNWSVLCFNDQNLSYQTSNYTFYVDTFKPSISLINPGNMSSVTASANINFQFNATDNLDTSLSCNLTLNNVVNNTVPISATSGLITTYPLSNVPDGNYTWNVSCSDDAANKNISYTYNFNVSVPPTVTGISPVPPPTQVFGGNVTFAYTATDNSGILNCSLYIDNVRNQTNTTINTTGTNYFYVYNMDEYMHTWYVNCTDTSGLRGVSTARIFYIDRFPPSITLINPGNQSQQNTSSISFSFNATDNRASQLTCNLSMDDAVVYPSMIAVSGGLTNVTINNTQNGDHNWSVMCWDLAINKNTSLIYYFNVSVPPIINLTSPGNNYFSGSGNITFIYNATGSPGLDNCSLYINGVFNQTNTTTVVNGDLNNFTLNNIPEGRYNWSILCYDNSTVHLSTLSLVRNFTVDKTAPNITLNYPDGLNNVTTNNITFNFTAYDNYAQNMSCNIWLSGAIEWPGITVFNGTPFVITKKLNDGLFDWYVECYDAVDNFNVSNTINFTVEAPPNVTLINPQQNSWSNITNITFIYYFEDWLGFGYCDLIIDGVNVTSDGLVDPFQNNTFNYTLTEGIHNWTVNCTDVDNNPYMPQPRTFYVDVTPPVIYINNPQNNSNHSSGNMNFSFNVTDNIALNTTCSAIINSSSFNQLISINATNNTENIFYRNLTDNYYSWSVMCNDLANNSFNTGNYYFNISQKPSINYLFPNNNTWTYNRNITFFFNVSDNDVLLNCSIYLDGVLNNTKNTSLTNNGRNNITVNNIIDGAHSWFIRCFDNGTYNNFNDSLTYYFAVDNTPPNILLNSPPNGNITLNDSVIFNFTAYDAISNNMTCNLTLDSTVIYAFINATNGSDVTFFKGALSLGMHYWNVTCWDQLNNTNTSLTYNFTVPMPDLMVNDSSIVFSSENPVEFSNITINATVWNLGNSNANNITVQLFNGNPSLGLQISTNQTINNITPGGFEIIQFNYTLGVGTLNIYLVVDPPIASNGSIKEDNESNNMVNRSLTVSSWQYLLGYEQATLKMFDPIFNTLFEWNVTNNTGKIFAADTDSNINWLNLYAISRDTTDSYISDDFYDADLKMGIENNSDSINFTYTASDLPKQLINLTVFNRQILNIPIYNSTNNSNFITGILWDATNSNSYNGSQDIIFVTRVSKNTVGYNDTYDFELRIPSKLRSYKGSTDTVSLYTEIN